MHASPTIVLGRSAAHPGPVAVATILAVVCAGGCTPAGRPLDLLQAGAPLEFSVNGRGWDWGQRQAGKPLRIADTVVRALPASFPSRLVYALEVPSQARLHLLCGIPEERHDRPGVEFVVKLRRAGREQVLATRLVDPLRRVQDRRWVPLEVDLAAQAGAKAELVLETRGYERSDEARTAFWGAPALAARARAPLVVIYLVDTLRADHTGVYGYGRGTTPQLDAFAREAVVFEQAVAHASWTKPAVASLFTSLLPGRHGASQLRDPLDEQHVTLAEMLHAKGFATGAAVANAVIFMAGSHFEQGFDFFAGLHGPRGHASKDVAADVVVDSALRFLDTRRGLPTLLYVHTMDPHVPYTPPAPFDRRYAPHPLPESPGVDPRNDYRGRPGDLERLVAQYDGEVAYGDQEFGRFLRELKARGLYDDALLVFLADHGEEFQDHGRFLHGRSVFDELVRIPLLVKFPRGAHAGRRVAEQVQQVDVLPTVLQALDLPVPASPAILGRPLQAVVAGVGSSEPPAHSEISHRGFVAHALRTRQDKYVQRYSPEEDELYFDLRADPREQHDRLAERRERARALRTQLESGLAPNRFRHVLRAVGPGRYELELRTRGWIEDVQTEGLGPGDSQVLAAAGRRLSLRLDPRPGRPREVSFRVRPRGARVWLDGRHDGRALAGTRLLVGAGAQPVATAGALRLPDIESEDGEVPEDVFRAPPVDRPGLHLWLRPERGQRLLVFGQAAREQLRGLGYLGN